MRARALHFVPLAAVVLMATTSLGAESLAAADPLADAQARIERYRMAEGQIRVVDADGQPAAGAEVAVEQTRHAFLFGSNIYAWGRVDQQDREQAYRQRFADLFNFATIGFYWASYEPLPGQPAHEYAEAVAGWCLERAILPKGHPLAWNHADPRWLPDDPGEVYRLQLARIDDCVQRFDGQIDVWDVVNEAVHFERDESWERAPKITRAWEQAGRIPFTRECFERARRANPRATLLINDYRVDPPYERLIEQLVDGQGTPLYDVIGLQSHMHRGAWTNEQIWDVCERFRRFGVPLHFTELTILSGQPGWELGPGWETTPEREAEQAREVERVYTLLFSHPAVEAITWWDLSDQRAWQGAPAGLLRRDMSPKPAYEALYGLIRDAWWTRSQLTAGEDGNASFRGFLGDYELKVRLDGRDVARQRVALERDSPNAWTIQLP